MTVCTALVAAFLSWLTVSSTQDADVPQVGIAASIEGAIYVAGSARDWREAGHPIQT